ncbi:hypothetical protein HMPREF1076_04476 [Parabacteroides goldsteinii CL02T12C30]|uniref:Uncharacterized protein n=1 Tax=Parabacteroides goldsteinii CL02T12C30 TaxID=999418 RepID=K5Y895_9BACT|nr:hypothetical protein HMPREF1076_04476 [Parabacteroides goldsteinii CL02T12C30]
MFLGLCKNEIFFLDNKKKPPFFKTFIFYCFNKKGFQHVEALLS